MAMNIFVPRVRTNKYKAVRSVIISEIDIFEVLGNLYYTFQIIMSSSLFSRNVVYN